MKSHKAGGKFIKTSAKQWLHKMLCKFCQLLINLCKISKNRSIQNSVISDNVVTQITIMFSMCNANWFCIYEYVIRVSHSWDNWQLLGSIWCQSWHCNSFVDLYVDISFSLTYQVFLYLRHIVVQIYHIQNNLFALLGRKASSTHSLSKVHFPPLFEPYV